MYLLNKLWGVRKLTRFDNETRTLIEVFNMIDYEKLPEV